MYIHKAQGRNPLLHYDSNHPKHLLDSLPKSQTLRVVRIDSDATKKQEDLSEMYTKFLERGYPKKLLLDIKNWALTLKREEDLCEQTEHSRNKKRDGGGDVYYVGQYGPYSTEVKKSVIKHFPLVNTDETISKKATQEA
ncbi:hypothetical protein XELAEV_18003244mg [Xenopus laevis]|uniref:Helix-turn-helix domain-containing protein n=1 Tax=Xenopus laevis TaxID=8355 RepID=A0A974GYS2_XENLA|nr:hypothetical protein XELAEV_18003244mg [Xenopus laevis]